MEKDGFSGVDCNDDARPRYPVFNGNPADFPLTTHSSTILRTSAILADRQQVSLRPRGFTVSRASPDVASVLRLS